MKQLQFALRVPYGGESAHQLADTGAVDIIHIVQADDNFFLAVIYKLADGLAPQCATAAQRNLAAAVHDRNVVYLPAGRLNSHGIASSGFYSGWWLPLLETLTGSFLTITSSAPPPGAIWTSNWSIKAFMRKRPRPEVRSRFSSSSGSGISCNSKPLP